MNFRNSECFCRQCWKLLLQSKNRRNSCEINIRLIFIVLWLMRRQSAFTLILKIYPDPHCRSWICSPCKALRYTNAVQTMRALENPHVVNLLCVKLRWLKQPLRQVGSFFWSKLLLMQRRLKSACGGMGIGSGGGECRSKCRPETSLMVTCHTGEFVQMALLLADSFLGMKEKCREEAKPKYCPVQ